MSGQNRILAILLGVLAGLVLLVGGLSAVLLLSGGDDDDDTVDVGRGWRANRRRAAGSLRLAGSDPITLDPHIAGDAGSATYIVEIFSGLMTITPDLEIVPDLAESFEVNPDGTQYTFTLRNGITFHNGRAVTAEDVKCSIERASSRELASAPRQRTWATSSARARRCPAARRTSAASR